MRPIWERWGTAFETRGIIMATLALLAIAAAVGAQDAPSGKGSKVMFEKTCSACHTAESVASARRTRDQWQDVMEEMVSQQGAKIADDEFTPILEYLVAAYGKVNVNTASADEIAQITGLSQKEAEAIVKFRKDNGKFEDFDALGKVPGVDLKKLEMKRDAIAY
jgi:competence ComEA-like helix-hairpin-helix protein